MAVTKTAATIIAAGTVNASGATTRGAIDVSTQDGGLVTIKLTNGSSPPTVQAVARVMVSHNTGATPATAAAGADWKTVYQFGGGIVANDVTEFPWRFGMGVRHIQVEVTGNTGQAVICEALSTNFAAT